VVLRLQTLHLLDGAKRATGTAVIIDVFRGLGGAIVSASSRRRHEGLT
jgi:hypothetical protein